jgi:23S rRNA (uracil1939-C5)-methyltransferase
VIGDPVVRIAARGDGVTESGRHIAFGVPGDVLLDDGALAPGKHHQMPPCRHFPECGGCQLQHVDDMAYRDYLVSRVAGAIARHGIETEIRDPHLSPPMSRRRATLKAIRASGRVLVGFHGAKSHEIVDLRECHVLVPALFALVARLRSLLDPWLRKNRAAEIGMTLIEGGVDLSLKGVDPQGFEAQERLVDFAQTAGLARLSIDRGLGPEAVYEPNPAMAALSGRLVAFPPGSFLQATEDGEAALVEAVREALSASKRIADLFAGLGTFALALDAAYAAEAGRDQAAALRGAAPAMRVDHRDLYRRPLDADELAAFDGVVLDPPRAGAEEQVRQLAGSSVPRIAYASCNPATFARDAKALVDGGYRLDWIKPVGQFRWSTHVELAAAFTYGG